MNENINTMILKSAVRGHRCYRVEGERIKKIWNNGMGLLDFITITPNDELLINCALWRKTDAKIASDILSRRTGIKNIRVVYYGYPLYYNHCFGTHNPPACEVTERRINRDIANYGKRAQNAA